MSRPADIAATVTAGATGAAFTVLTVGATPAMMLPAVAGVAAVAVLTSRPEGD